MPLRLVYRADGGHPVGTGHIWRGVRILRALAERTELEARIVFADDPFARGAAARAPATAVVLPPRNDVHAVKPLLTAGPLLEHLRDEPCDVLVVDMLDTPDDAMAALAATGASIVTLDDRGDGRKRANLLVNTLVQKPEPNALPSSSRASPESGTTCAL